ncbi:MAG: PfkB family carbohydrate kinase [Candidatus Amesbacteria bacterium]|nr:PfkB family carbohydrate kinase [Candidatus Amesbacteria bacterium]
MVLNVALLGGIYTDISSRVEKIPQVNEVKISTGFKMGLGGKATNVAIGLSRLGINSYLIGRIGNDIRGKNNLDIITLEKVNTKFISIDQESETGAIILIIQPDGQQAIVSNKLANYKITINDIDKVLTDIDNDKIKFDMAYVNTELLPEIVNYAISEFSKRNIKVIVDLGPKSSVVDQSKYQFIDFLTANQHEASQFVQFEITNKNNIKQVMSSLSNKGSKNIVITMGKDGGAYLSKENSTVETFDADNINVIDSTAAGDAFRAGFIYKYLTTQSISDAILFAKKCSSFSVQKFGAYESLPRLSELAD